MSKEITKDAITTINFIGEWAKENHSMLDEVYIGVDTARSGDERVLYLYSLDGGIIESLDFKKSNLKKK